MSGDLTGLCLYMSPNSHLKHFSFDNVADNAPPLPNDISSLNGVATKNVSWTNTTKSLVTRRQKKKLDRATRRKTLQNRRAMSQIKKLLRYRNARRRRQLQLKDWRDLGLGLRWVLLLHFFEELGDQEKIQICALTCYRWPFQYFVHVAMEHR